MIGNKQELSYQL